MTGTTAIGIDLGSYYGRVAAIIDGTVKTIEINGDIKMPCIFSEKFGSLSTGNKATKTAPTNVIFDACRLQADREYSETWCFAKIQNGSYWVENKNDVDVKIVQQEDGISAILKALVDAAEKQLQKKVGTAVITVPDYIDQNYRRIILNAAKLTNIGNVYLQSQNAAAATNYLLNKPNKTYSPSFFMIFNFGASHLSISVYKAIGSNAELVYNVRDDGLGGEDFTIRMTEKFLKFVKDQESNNFIANNKTLKYIREAAEKAKIDLSLMNKTICTMEVVGEEERSHQESLKRDIFESLCQDFFQRIESCVGKVARAFQDSSNSITEVVMVGGSSRIFAVKGIIQNFFPEANFNSTLVPEEAIVYGSAINAAMMNGSNPSFYVNVSTNASYSIYCETEYSRIKVLNNREKLPSTPRYISYHLPISKVEFFENSNTYRSLGYIEIIDANEEFVCEVDINGILKCYVNGNIVNLNSYCPAEPLSSNVNKGSSSNKELGDENLNFLLQPKPFYTPKINEEEQNEYMQVETKFIKNEILTDDSSSHAKEKKFGLHKIDAKTYILDIRDANPPSRISFDLTDDFKKNNCNWLYGRFEFKPNNFITTDRTTTVQLLFSRFTPTRDVKTSDIIFKHSPV